MSELREFKTENYYKNRDDVWELIGQVQRRLNSDEELVAGEVSYLFGLLQLLEWLMNEEADHLPCIEYTATKRRM